MLYVPLSRLCSIARLKPGKKPRYAGRTRNMTSRHAERVRLTFAPRPTGGCQRRAPSGGSLGGSAALHGRQRGCAARKPHFRWAQRSGSRGCALHASPALQLQASHTRLTFDTCLARASRACAVDRRDHHHHLRGRGRRCGRLWLDLHRLRALLAAVCVTAWLGLEPGRADPTPGADPSGDPTAGGLPRRAARGVTRRRRDEQRDGGLARLGPPPPSPRPTHTSSSTALAF